MSLTHIIKAAALTSVALNPDEVELFINGLVTGLVDDDNLDAVKTCIQDVEGLDVDITEAIADFKKGGMNQLIDGAKKLYDAVVSAKGDLSQCEAMKGDWERIEKWGKIFGEPTTLTKTVITNVIKNRSEIGKDIAEIKTDEANNKPKDLGITIANLLVALVGEVPESSLPNPVQLELAQLMVTFTREEVILFINGLVTGLVQDDDLENVEKCVQDTEEIDTLLQKAISEFKEGGIQNIINGAQTIGQIIEAAYGDMNQCKEMEDDWIRIKKWSDEFKDPNVLFTVVMQNFIANRSGIMADIAEIKADEASGNAKDLGLTIADLLIKAVGEVPASPSPQVFLY